MFLVHQIVPSVQPLIDSLLPPNVFQPSMRVPSYTDFPASRYLAPRTFAAVTQVEKLIPTVYLIDDDEKSRNGIRELLEKFSIPSIPFDSASRFFSLIEKEPVGCLVVEQTLTDLSGMDFFRRIQSLGWILPTIIVTRQGAVKDCVEAFSAGIFGYHEKPLEHDPFLATVRGGLELSQKRLELAAHRVASQKKLDNLTQREKEVLEMLIEGHSMKNIAAMFGTSFQAVARHRQRILDKLGVEGDVALTRWVLHHRYGADSNN